MKASCALAASVLAASVAALSSSSSSSDHREANFTSCTEVTEQEYSHSSSASGRARKGQPTNSCGKASVVTEKFAPRFDGLRFIETLVTAHR